MSLATQLSEKIRSKNARVGTVGVGYVGSAVGEAAAAYGFRVIGFARSLASVQRMNARNIPSYQATRDTTKLTSCDIICVCVPTPIYKNKSPNLRFFRHALSTIARHLHRGQLIIIESSVAPGTTRSVALPILESSGLRAGHDFYLCFSPERIDPGNLTHGITNIPKVVSGLDADSLSLAQQFYACFVDTVVPVSSFETAELTKVLENVFRLVNISLVNEMTQYAGVLGIDMWEVIRAAATKPFGFLAHFPGPGAGGDCIPVLAHQLITSSRKVHVPLRVVEAAAIVNDLQPKHVAEKVSDMLKVNGIVNNHPKVLLIGITYKPDVADLRQSPALKVWQYLEARGLEVSYHDPYILRYNGATSRALTRTCVEEHDIIVITTPHKAVAYEHVLSARKPILDTHNVFNHRNLPYVSTLS